MRVGFLIDRWQPERGGAERALQAFALHLMERGHDVHVFASEIDPEAAGVCHEVRVSGATRGARERKLANALVEAADDAGCHVTVGMRHLPRVGLYWPHDGAHRATLRAQRLARSLPQDPRWLGRHRTFLELEQRLLSEGNARVIACVSELVRRELLEHHPSCAERLRVVENGVDLSRFHPDRRMDRGWYLRGQLGLDARTPLFVFAGGDGVRKGLPQLFEALAGLRHERWRLVVAGVRHVPRWRRIARSHGLAEEHVDVVEAQDPVALFTAADLMVLPTWRDASGLVILEALACGTPVVTTARAGAADAVASPAAGAVVEEPSDVDGLRAAIEAQRERIVRDEIDRSAVRACVLQRDSSRWMESLEECLREAVPAPSE